MTEYDPAKKATAYEELDQLTADFRAAEQALERARVALREGIVRHLTERSGPPGELSQHTPYDRNHVGRIAREEGVPLIREPKPKTTRKRAGGKTSG